MEKDFTVGEKSIVDFFAKYLVGEDKSSLSDMRGGRPNPYYYFKDEIYLNREVFVGYPEIPEHITFVLSDEGQGSRKKLDNTYLYRVVDYDSVSFKLILEDFKTSLA